MFPWNPPNFVILPAARKQGFPPYYRFLIKWAWPRPSYGARELFFDTRYAHIMSSRSGLYPREAFHVLVSPQTSFGVRSSRIHFSPTNGFSYERVAQFNLEWIFSKLDSGFQSLVGFRILSAGFRIPKPRIPDSTSKKFLDSGIRIPLHGRRYTGVQVFLLWGKVLCHINLGYLFVCLGN